MGRSIPDLIWWRNFLRNSNHASEYSLNEPCRRSRSHFFEISVPSFERSELGVRKPLVNSPTRDKSLRWCVVGDNEKKNGQEDRNISAKEFPIDCVILVKRFLEETSNDKFQLRWLAHFPLTPPLLPLLIKSSRSKPVVHVLGCSSFLSLQAMGSWSVYSWDLRLLLSMEGKCGQSCVHRNLLLAVDCEWKNKEVFSCETFCLEKCE